jgi:hypothetical protein
VTITTFIIMLVALGLSMLAAFVIITGAGRLRRLRGRTRGTAQVAALAARSPAPESGGERQASAAAEMLESIIQRLMAGDPIFAGQALDFGSSPDGSLEIWWGGQSYSGVEQLPDERLRALIGQAIEEFNRGAGVQN